MEQVGRSSGKSGTGREVFSGVWDWSVGPFRGQGWLGGTLEGPDWSGDPPKGLRRVVRTFTITEMGGEILRKF